jgi:hypothetical protein
LLIALGVLALVACLHFSYRILSVEPKTVLGAIWLTILPLEAALIALRFSIPAEGHVRKAIRWSSRQRQALFWLFGGIALYVAAPYLALAHRFLGLATAFLGVACICACLFLAMASSNRRLREDNRTRKCEELKSAAEESVRRWNQLDAETPPSESAPL